MNDFYSIQSKVTLEDGLKCPTSKLYYTADSAVLEPSITRRDPIGARALGMRPRPADTGER